MASPLFLLTTTPDTHPKRTKVKHDTMNAYEVKPSDGKGLGVFATRDIAVGELILAEKPLVVASDLKHVEEALGRLTDEQKGQYRELVSKGSAGDANGSANGSDSTTNDESAAFKRLAIPLARPGTEGNEPFGVFVIISRINHSCTPNVCLGWHESYGSKHRRASVTSPTSPTVSKGGQGHDYFAVRGSETVHAVRPIKAGDELLGLAFPVYNTQTWRKKYSQQQFGFTCACAACTATHNPESDNRRVRIGDLDDEIAWAKAPNPLQAYKYTRERLRLTDAEGLAVPLESADTHLEAYDICMAKKDYHAAQRHAAMAHAYRELALGHEHGAAQEVQAKERQARQNLPKHPTKAMPMMCDACGSPAQNACEGCKAALYCGEDCKKGHEEWHGPVCKVIQKAEAVRAK